MTPLGRSALPGLSWAISRAGWFCFLSLKNIHIDSGAPSWSLTCQCPEGRDINSSGAIFHMMHLQGRNSGLGQDLKTWQVAQTRSSRPLYRAMKPFLSYYPTTVFSLNPCGFATQILIFQIFLKIWSACLHENAVFSPSLLPCQTALSSSPKDPSCQF